MQLNKFYSTLYEIPRAPFYDKFNFYFHGGILNWGENTTDIDVKLTPRIEPVTCNQIEETLYDLKRLEVAGIFFKKIHTWNEKLRPNFEQIENSEAVLQAVIDMLCRPHLHLQKQLHSFVLYLWHIGFYHRLLNL